METLIEYLLNNSPYAKEDLTDYTIEQLESLAYSYGMPGVPAPKEGYREI
jgi:hypothetical protein